ncbi:MAG: type II and III secretion system protein, partial [Candidatus Omnitrophica bacterium]|nr:type II and III secretion system protein [Candidatus Omnitrophota bacterium]
SNEVAEIRIITDAATSSTSSSQTTTGTITTQFERNTVGTVLRVIPLITDGKYITMVIEPEVSRVVESAKFTDALDPDRRAARATIMVEDGQTAMIAGLLSQDRQLGNRKVPLLGDIPFLGAAFTRANDEVTDTEIIIFITPHIVPEHALTKAAPVPVIPRREQSPAAAERGRRKGFRRPWPTEP